MFIYIRRISDFKPRKRRSNLTLSASPASGRPGQSFWRSKGRDGFVVVVVIAVVVIFIFSRILPVMTRERGGRGGRPRSPGVVLDGVRWPTSLRFWDRMSESGASAPVLSPYFGGRRQEIISIEGRIVGDKSDAIKRLVDLVFCPFTFPFNFFYFPLCLA